MKTRQNLPQYAEYSAISLTWKQFRAISKGRTGKIAYTDPINVTKTKDGRYWAEWKGEMVFWAHKWYEIPKTVGKRAEKLQDFIEELAKN